MKFNSTVLLSSRGYILLVTPLGAYGVYGLIVNEINEGIISIKSLKNYILSIWGLNSAYKVKYRPPPMGVPSGLALGLYFTIYPSSCHKEDKCWTYKLLFLHLFIHTMLKLYCAHLRHKLELQICWCLLYLFCFFCCTFQHNSLLDTVLDYCLVACVSSHMSHVTCHMSSDDSHFSPVSWHMSYVTCHLPPVTYH